MKYTTEQHLFLARRRLGAVRKAYRELQRTYMITTTALRREGARVLTQFKEIERLRAQVDQLQDWLKAAQDNQQFIGSEDLAREQRNRVLFGVLLGILLGVVATTVYVGTLGL